MLRGEIKGRFDPVFYKGYLFEILKNSKFPVKKIGLISKKMKSGFGAGKQDQTEDTNAIIQIRPTNINNLGFLKFDKNIYISKDKIPSENHILEKDTVLFNNTNSQELVGKTGIVTNNEIFTFSNHITAIKVDKQEILPQYLWLILNFYQKKKVFYSICTNWNNQSGVGIDLLKSIEIPVPPLSKQQEIVNSIGKSTKEKQENEKQAKELLSGIDDYLLNELDIKIPEKEEQNIFITTHLIVKGKRLDPYYYQSYFEKLENNIRKGKYNVKRLKYVSTKITSGATPLSGSDAYTDKKNGVPFIRSGNININGYINFNKLLYIKDEIHEKKLHSSQLQKNDLLIAIVGATIGQVGVYIYDKEGNINQAIALVRANTEINSNFIKEYLKSIIGQGILDRLKRPVARANINLDEIASILVVVPPIEIQNEIAEYIKTKRDKADKLQKEAKESYTNTKNEIEKMIINK